MIDLLRNRRSIRQYTSRPLPPETVALLQEAFLRAPTSRNRHPWHCTTVLDRSTIEQLSRCKVHGSAFLADAPCAMVICGDESISDVWVEDCAIASIILQLVAQSLGLGSCWIQVRNRMHDDTQTAESYIRSLLGFPGSLRVASIISLGYPAQERAPVDKNDLCRNRIHREHFTPAQE